LMFAWSMIGESRRNAGNSGLPLVALRALPMQTSITLPERRGPMRRTQKLHAHERLPAKPVAAKLPRLQGGLSEEAVDVCLECASCQADPDRPDRCIYWDDCDVRLAVVSSEIQNGTRTVRPQRDGAASGGQPRPR